MAGVSARQARFAFAKFSTNKWGVPASVTLGAYFEADGGIEYHPTIVAIGNFTESWDTRSDVGDVPAVEAELRQQTRYDDYGHVWDALAMGSPAAVTIATSAAGQVTSWQHVIDLADVIDGLGLTLAIDKVQYVEELTSAKVHGFSLKNGSGGIMQTSYKVLGSKPTIQSSININSTVASATFPALGNRVFRKHGVLRMNLTSAGALGTTDIVKAADIEFAFERPQEAPQVFGQDFVDEASDTDQPTAVLSIAYPRMNTTSANSLYAALRDATALKADLTFLGAFINSTDQYTRLYQWPSLQLTRFQAPVAAGDRQVKPHATFKATMVAAAPAGMSVVAPFRLTLIRSSAYWAFSEGPPSTPMSPTPADLATGATDLSLTWSSIGATTYDVYFGGSLTPPLVSTNQAAATYTLGTLSASTNYYWKIVARNSVGSTAGPIWSFGTTTAAPAVPNTPTPADAATNVIRDIVLRWSSARAAAYDVYFGTVNPPPLVSTGQSAASYAPAELAITTTYYLKIVAKNNIGTSTGPVWSFATGTVEDTVTVLTTTSTGTQDDFNPGTLGNLTVLRCNNASLLTIRGLANGVDGQLLWVESIGAGQVDIANQNAGSVAGNRVINNVTATISLAAGSGRALLCYDATTARWRVIQHEQGAWINVPFSAGDFTGGPPVSSMTVTVSTPDTYRYRLSGRTLHFELAFNNASIGGTPSSQILMAMFGGFVPAASYVRCPCVVHDNGTRKIGTVVLGTSQASGANLNFQVDAIGSNWTASTNQSGVNAAIAFDVQ